MRQPPKPSEKGSFVLDASTFLLETHDESLAVRVTHLPSGLAAVGDSGSDQTENAELALDGLAELLVPTEHDMPQEPWIWQEY